MLDKYNEDFFSDGQKKKKNIYIQYTYSLDVFVLAYTLLIANGFCSPKIFEIFYANNSFRFYS